MPKNSSEYPAFWADSLEKLKAFQVEVGAPGSRSVFVRVCLSFSLFVGRTHCALLQCTLRYNLRVPPCAPPTHSLTHLLSCLVLSLPPLSPGPTGSGPCTTSRFLIGN